MNLLKHLAKLDKEKVKKSFTLYATMMFSVVVGILISIVNTRYLGKEQYGDFKFIINIFSFFVTFLTFGFYYSAGRLLAQKKELSEKKKLSGTILAIASIISVVLILLILVFSYIENYIFEHNLGQVIRYCLPLLFIFPFQLCLEQLLQGDNKIYQLSILRIGPKLLYLGIAVLITFVSELNLTMAILGHLLSFAVIIGGVIVSLRYKIRFNSDSFKEIKKENITYGFPVYLGAITGIASNYIAGISISYFIDNINVGFYSLAITATMPLAMLPAVFGTVFFKDFVSAKRIGKKTILLTYILGFLSLFGFLIFIEKIVIFLYTEEFRPVIELSYYIAIGSALHGLGDFYNRFISAKGKGNVIRNINIILGVFNVMGYVIFVYFWDTKGAAITRLISGFIYFLLASTSYYKFITKK